MENKTTVLNHQRGRRGSALLRAHVQRALGGKIAGVPQLAHVNMGRRKLVRKEWLEQWMEEGKASCIVQK